LGSVPSKERGGDCRPRLVDHVDAINNRHMPFTRRHEYSANALTNVGAGIDVQ
jgi:hypothetical protein